MKNSNHLTLEQRLCRIANDINKKIGANNQSECSIYLYDYRRDKHVLRASTKPSPYLGKDELNISETVIKRFHNNDITKIGISVLSILQEKTIVSKKGEISNDVRFSSYGLSYEEIKAKERNHFCEFPLENIGSVISSPIKSKIEGQIDGVIRVVRFKDASKKFNKYFTEKDIINLDEIIKENATWIHSGVFISQLIELGTYMNLESLCTKAAEVFKNLLNCKGCSIFLLDDKESDKSNKIYKCYGTTGLVKRLESEKLIDIKDPLTNEEAWYLYSKEKINDETQTSLTIGVINARMSAFVNDLYDQKDIAKQFPDGFKINRKEGIGKVCEKHTTDDGKYLQSESILYSPMFFCDPNNKFVDVLGVVRVVRPKEDDPNPFSEDQMHLFVSLVEHLSKAVMTAKLIHFFDDLSRIEKRENLFRYVVSNIPKYIGAKECAILLKEEDRLVKYASWQDGVELGADKSNYYDLSNNHEKGYTFYVAQHNQELMFNGHKDLKDQFKTKRSSDRPSHNPKSGDEPYRFLGIPIRDSSENLIAVIRACKAEESTRFTSEDKQMLERIANHLKNRIELFNQQEKINIELEKKIPRLLQNKIDSLEKITCGDLLKSFLNKDKTYDTIEESIIEFVPNLWNYYKPTFGNHSSSALKRFEFFNDRILSTIPYYRDHFIHQFIVFLLGISILEKIDYSTIFSTAYSETKESLSNKSAEVSWFLTSFFHDVAYPLQTVNKWFWSIINVFIPEGVKTSKTNIPIDSILFNFDYIESIEKLSNFHTKNLKRDEKDIQRIIIDLLSKKSQDSGLDHGLMAALMLIGDKRFELRDILPVSSAIALHNKLGENRDIDSIIFERHPLAFLLIYCDLLHEWGRINDEVKTNKKEVKTDKKMVYPLLKNLEYVKNIKNLPNYNNEIETLAKEKELNYNIPCVFAEIHVDDYISEKHKEARNKFNRLRSSSINFFMKINNTTFVSRPD